MLSLSSVLSTSTRASTGEAPSSGDLTGRGHILAATLVRDVAPLRSTGDHRPTGESHSGMPLLSDDRFSEYEADDYPLRLERQRAAENHHAPPLLHQGEMARLSGTLLPPGGQTDMSLDVSVLPLYRLLAPR